MIHCINCAMKHNLHILKHNCVIHFLQCSASCLGGYYTEKLLNQTGFRMLVLNTNLYYDQNKQTQDLDDPAGQFSWADQVLTDAANNKEKAKHPAYLCHIRNVMLVRISTTFN